MLATYDYVPSNNSLQWLLLCTRACQQLSHFWISKEPDAKLFLFAAYLVLMSEQGRKSHEKLHLRQ